MICKFINKMNFEIKMRKVWEHNSPAIKLQPGQILEGPYEYLSTMPFLAPIIDTGLIDSTTDFRQIPIIKETVKEVIKEEDKTQLLASKLFPSLVSEPERLTESVSVSGFKTISEPEQKEEPFEDFDPVTVNWLSVKTPQLEEKCRRMNIDISHLKTLKPKEKKWELVKLIKAQIKK